MIQRPCFILVLALLVYALYILIYALLMYLYYTYFILVYYTSIQYHTLIISIYDPTSYFTLTLFSPHCLHGGKLFKISCALTFLESTRSEFTVCNTHAKNNKIVYSLSARLMIRTKIF